MLRANISWAFPEPSQVATLQEAILASRELTLQDLILEPEDPSLLPDMDIATDIILDAIEKQETIYIFGDYDVDGMTAGAGLVKGLRRFGANAEVYIPNRTEGFGLNAQVIEKIAGMGAKLVITVDNGSDRKDVVDRAHELGMRVIVTDHHPISPKKMAKAEAVVNPCRTDSKYHFNKLCGSGIAYFVSEALSKKVVERGGEKVDVSDLIALASLGTMADVVDIVGPNRYIVEHGLPLLPKLPGLKALLDLKGLRNPTARDVTFLIIPMLNAPGRLDSPVPAVDLLLCDDLNQAEELANLLHIANEKRRKIGGEMFNMAKKQVDDPRKFPDSLSSIFFWTTGTIKKDKNGVEQLEGFQHGLVGILAGQLAETYGRPSFVGAVELGSDILKGSARSGCFDAEGNQYSVKEIMDKAEAIYQERYRAIYPQHENLFHTYGGHPAAAGFSTSTELTKVLRDCLEKATAPLMRDVPMGRVLRADVTWPLPVKEEIDSLEVLEPTGHGFEAPVFYVPDVEVSEIRYAPIPGQSFKARTIVLSQGDRSMEAVCFKKGQQFEIGKRLDVLCSPHREGLQIQDFREHSIEAPAVAIAAAEYDLDSLIMG